jgi:hypothetical protein
VKVKDISDIKVDDYVQFRVSINYDFTTSSDSKQDTHIYISSGWNSHAFNIHSDDGKALLRNEIVSILSQNVSFSSANMADDIHPKSEKTKDQERASMETLLSFNNALARSLTFTSNINTPLLRAQPIIMDMIKGKYVAPELLTREDSIDSMYGGLGMLSRCGSSIDSVLAAQNSNRAPPSIISSSDLTTTDPHERRLVSNLDALGNMIAPLSPSLLNERKAFVEAKIVKLMKQSETSKRQSELLSLVLEHCKVQGFLPPEKFVLDLIKVTIDKDMLELDEEDDAEESATNPLLMFVR